MKICLEANQLLALWGGTRRYTFNLIENLLKIDRKNQYILFYNFYLKREKKLPKFPFKNVQNKVFHLPEQLSNFLWNNFNFPKIENLVGKIDLLHGLYFSLPATNAPSVLTILEVTYLKHPEVYKNLTWYEYSHKVLLPKLLKKTQKIITISKCVKNDLLDLFNLKEDRIKVIPLGVEDRFFQKNQKNLDNFLKKYDLEKGKYILDVAGTLEPKKNIKNLFLAYQILEKKYKINYPLVVVSGAGDLPFETSKRIKFIQALSDSDLPLLYQGASLFVYPSLYEGFGLPILEAMASGIPVITSNVSAMPEVAGDGALLTNPEDPFEMADKMAKALQDRELRESLRKKGQRRARQFSWERTARETLKVYEEIKSEIRNSKS